jgi:hypothetical protein
MAHEIGHILLPAENHSGRGIMSAHPDVWSKSVRYFAAEHGAMIRSLLAGSARPDFLEHADTRLTHR